MAALQQANRVISINLTVTTPLLAKLSTIKSPFSKLEDLVLLSLHGLPLTMLRVSPFQWGQHLRRIHFTRVAFPALLQLLSSSANLIDLQLHEVFHPWKFTPEMLMKTLSNLGQLRSLSLHLCSAAYYRHFPPPEMERIFLPVLTRLNFRGSMAYLESIVAMIDVPLLEDIEITLFDHPVLAHSKLNTFINQIEMYRSHCGAHVLSSRPTISFSLTQPGAPMCLKLQLLCKPLRMQISSLAQICLNSPFLFKDKWDRCIIATRPSVRMNSSHGRELLELLNLFTGKRFFHLNEKLLAKCHAYFATSRDSEAA